MKFASRAFLVSGIYFWSCRGVSVPPASDLINDTMLRDH